MASLILNLKQEGETSCFLFSVLAARAIYILVKALKKQKAIKLMIVFYYCKDSNIEIGSRVL